MGIRTEFLKKEEQINQRREIFAGETKQMISDTFREYIRKHKLDDLLFVDAADKFVHFQSIFISEVSRPSGIYTNEDSILFEKGKDQVDNVIYKGGALIFSQKYDGHLVAVFSPPSVKDIAESKGLVILDDNIDPSELTQDKILGFLEEYFQRILSWGVQTNEIEEHYKLGFKIPERKRK